MPNWNDLLDEIKSAGSGHDVVRRKYLKRLFKYTKRNVIAYYSGWLQKPEVKGGAITDEDKNGLMTTVHNLDRSKGLDLVLHTPGGDVAAVESIVDYLRRMFGTDIRAIVPQLAMSGGTMISCACKSIVMGKPSNLGPIDPQLGGLPAHGILEEFMQAHNEVKVDPTKATVWQPIIANYRPTLIGECLKAIQWSEQIVKDWLRTGMLASAGDAENRIDVIWHELGDHALTLSHARHLNADKCRDMGLVVEQLEDDPKLQEAVLSVHHSMMHTLSGTPAFKIIENHRGKAFIKHMKMVVVQQ
jgi:hypothetical protein